MLRFVVTSSVDRGGMVAMFPLCYVKTQYCMSFASKNRRFFYFYLQFAENFGFPRARTVFLNFTLIFQIYDSYYGLYISFGVKGHSHCKILPLQLFVAKVLLNQLPTFLYSRQQSLPMMESVSFWFYCVARRFFSYLEVCCYSHSWA